MARILADKQLEIEAALKTESLLELRSCARDVVVRDFASALRAGADRNIPAVIAEIKFTSPSAGALQPAGSKQAAEIAQGYEAAGATCLSVLTDRKYFDGDMGFLTAARAACSLPLLCKDFVLHPLQIWQARARGADALLLIVAALTDSQLADLAAEALEAGLAVLVEVHSEEELHRVLHTQELDSAIIGINNRDLTTFETSLEVTERLAGQVPGDRLVVSESGIATGADMRRLMRAGAGAFLIGESLMSGADPGKRLAALLAL